MHGPDYQKYKLVEQKYMGKQRCVEAKKVSMELTKYGHWRR